MAEKKNVPNGTLVAIQVQTLKAARKQVKVCYKLTADDVEKLIKFVDKEKVKTLRLTDTFLISLNCKPQFTNKVFIRVEPQKDGYIQIDCYDESEPSMPNTSAVFKLQNNYIDNIVTPLECAGCGEEEHAIMYQMSTQNAKWARQVIEAILYAKAEDENSFTRLGKSWDYVLSDKFKALVNRLVIVPAFTRTYKNGKTVRVGPYRYYRPEPKQKKSN